MSSNPANVNRVAADRFSRLKALQRPAVVLQTKIGTDATGNQLKEMPGRLARRSGVRETRNSAGRNRLSQRTWRTFVTGFDSRRVLPMQS